MAYIFDANTETPESITRRRAVADQLAARIFGQAPQNIGQGIASIGQALIARQMANEADASEKAGRASANEAFAPILGGVAGPSVATAPAAPAAAPTASASPGHDSFISSIAPAVAEAAAKTGIDPRIITAQAAIESGWGKSAPGNNLFGIKSHGMPGGNTLPTTEMVNGQPVRTTDSFRAYASPTDSVSGYADFMLNNPRYKPVMGAQGLEAQAAALGQSGYATDPTYGQKVLQIARSLPAPAGAAPYQVAGPATAAPSAPAAPPAGPAAQPAAAQPAPATMPQVTTQQLVNAVSNPWATPGQKAVAQELLKQRIQMQTPEFGYTTLPDGTVLRTDKRGGAPVPVYQAATKPTFGDVGIDPVTGQPIKGFVDVNKRDVQVYQPPAQSTAPSTIPPAPPGVDPKVWREGQSKNALSSALPANFDDTAKARQEFAALPSYKNLSQAAPIYQAMHDAAGRNTKAADLNMVYGLGKIMDPGSVVREGEIQMANNAQGWQEKLNGIVAQINGQGGLTPEGRQALMAEAYGRIQAYKGEFDRDAARYKGIAERNRMNVADVVPDFGTFDPWTAPKATPSAPTQPAIDDLVKKYSK
ncbi:glycoside hydrolase family 73 protein [Bradyrhizobium japonicum]|uniref:glycoside hydrolase family 73 protein n=1 Tax=Bradyrhizobium japonicum TaxID=375 RepID=UPI001BA5285A|nr:glucosaminidase domain-containing protein [Bradyrhizobium japonicum]MBR0913129.1 glucosaminidase domain-containing protein [Bradyrhizobium japonicum]